MKYLNFIVEGSSEETFVNDVLVKHFAPLNIFISKELDIVESVLAKGG